MTLKLYILCVSDGQCAAEQFQRPVLQLLPQADPLHHSHPRHGAPRAGHGAGQKHFQPNTKRCKVLTPTEVLVGPKCCSGLMIVRSRPADHPLGT